MADRPSTPNPAGRALIIVGFGDSGRRLARRWLSSGGGPVIGLRRHPASEPALAFEGLQLSPFDLDDDRPLAPALGSPPPGGVIAWLAPPPGQGRDDPRLRRHLPELIRATRAAHLVLASTTGVYGRGAASGWTSEATPLRPDTDRAHRRAAAEAAAVALGQAAGISVTRLRIAAIYGPGRLPLARLQAGQPLSSELAARPGNRIHVDDLVEALYLAALHGRDGAVYNVADGHPVAFGAYLDACADALGLPRLSRDADAAPDPAADFLRHDRYIAADLIREELGLRLHYQDYRQGIRASLTGE